MINRQQCGHKVETYQRETKKDVGKLKTKNDGIRRIKKCLGFG